MEEVFDKIVVINVEMNEKEIQTILPLRNYCSFPLSISICLPISPSHSKDSETTTALIVDIGHDVTEVTPIHEGFVLIHQVPAMHMSFMWLINLSFSLLCGVIMLFD